MNWKQQDNRDRTKAHRLYQQKQIDRHTLGMLLIGRAYIGHGQILEWTKDWRGQWGWGHLVYIRPTPTS